MSGAVEIRPAGPDDQAFIVETCRRFADFDGPPFRTPEEIVEGEVRTLRLFFAGGAPQSTLLIAELDGKAAGFAYLEELVDYFTQARHGHVGMLAVTERSEGRGVGRALLAAAERWTRGRGFRSRALSVCDGNARARRLYERGGGQPDAVRSSKPR
jgi:GNAT superfamily N-acetyltransferase